MILTDEEKGMRDGAEGAATAAAMDLLSATGRAGLRPAVRRAQRAGSMSKPPR